jgi:hypothetical protein
MQAENCLFEENRDWDEERLSRKQGFVLKRLPELGYDFGDG